MRNKKSEKLSQLKEIRKQKGLTQIDLSNMTGVSVQWIQKIEQGWTTGVSRNVKEKIAGALGVSVWGIFPEANRKVEIFKMFKGFLPDMVIKERDEPYLKETLSRMIGDELLEIFRSGMDEKTALRLINKFAKKYNIKK